MSKDRPLRVVYYSDTPFSDCDFPLIRRLKASGVNVRYYIPFCAGRISSPLFTVHEQLETTDILPALEYPQLNYWKEYMDMEGVYVVNRIHRSGHLLNFFLYLKLVFQILLFRPDVVHLTYPPSGYEKLLYLFRRKLVLTVHDPFLHSGHRSKKSERQRREAFRVIPKLVLLNRMQRDDFIRAYKVRPEKIYVSRLGVYECLHYQVPPDEPAGESGTAPLGLGTEPYILFFGRISPYKGLDYLCEAMETVHKKQPRLRCVIAGSGKLWFNVPNRNYICLNNRFFDTDELARLIRGSLFCVCPYTDATQSGVVFSAFAYARPVVASDVGALAESVCDGQTGLLVPPRDSAALAEVIIRLAEDGALRERLSANITDRYLREGVDSWAGICRQYLDIYTAPRK